MRARQRYSEERMEEREKMKTEVKGEERRGKVIEKVKRSEQSNWRGPRTRQKGRGDEVKTKGRETRGTQSARLAYLR